MALFTTVDASRLSALLHVGFSARIQSPVTSTYLAEGPRSTVALVPLAAAPLWHIISRESPAVTNTPDACPRAAVALAPAPDAAPRYLSLRDSAPSVADEPCAVRLALPPAGGGTDVLFGLRQVLQDRLLLSGGGAVSLRADAGRCERWRLEVCAASLGRAVGSVGAEDGGAFLSVAEAATFAILELGVRFRLRSVHGRVLSTSAPAATGAPGAAAASAPAATPAGGARGKRKNRPVVVRQDGARARLDEAGDADLVLEPTRRSAAAGGARGFSYSLEDAAGGGVLSVGAANQEATRAMVHESAAVLRQLSVPDAARGRSGTVLVVAPSGRGWGFVHVGARATGDGGGEGGDPDGRAEWLMAGPRGRLETRRHRGAWESFRVEFVEQSFHASLRELPASSLFADADAADRALVRAEIAAKVSAARASSAPTASAKAAKSPAFNHAAALSGLGSGSKPGTGDEQADEAPPGKKRQAKPKGGKEGSQSAAAGLSAAAASTLPRNVASKKAKRRAKKEMKRRLAGGLTSGSGSGPASGPAPVGAETAASGPSSPSDADAASSGQAASSSTEGAPSAAVPHAGHGPPCAACGRACTGTYTKAMGKDFHPRCFGCRMCRRPLLPGTGQFREKGGAPYCNGCFAANIAPKCARCAKPIVETVTTAMEKTWHKECLTCTICRLPLTEQFWLYADKPNEPRCSRCVTGSEEPLQGVGYGGRGRRAVNLPGPLFSHGNAPGPTTTTMNGSRSSGGVGRARLTTSVVNPMARR
jgi:LIM domain